MKKFDKLVKFLNNINLREMGIFDFTVEYDSKTNLYTIIDSTEEFYYDGFAFERIHDEIEQFAKSLFGEDCYLECACPGRWDICS